MKDIKKRPLLKILAEESIQDIISGAYDLLENVGVVVKHSEALKLLADAGASVDFTRKIAKIKPTIVENALKTVPSSIKVHTQDGEEVFIMGGDEVYYTPGSVAISVVDAETKKARRPITDDCIANIWLVNMLKNIKIQSGPFNLSDVPPLFADSYRFYLLFTNTSMPILGGVFAKESFKPIKDMLAVRIGGEEEIKKKPSVFMCNCPSPPLQWSEIICQSLMDCAKYGIPAIVLSMPISGGNAPATLMGTLVQHTAENLSGIVIHQLVGPGSPIIYGGSPSILDMRKGTAAMGAIETFMICSAYVQIGKYFGIPTHSFCGFSDSKVIDAQAGLESGIGMIMAALAGINLVSAPGMLESESRQSLEKLVIDNEIAGMAYRLLDGINCGEKTIATHLIKKIGHMGDFISLQHTLEWFRKEQYIPSPIVDRGSGRDFERRGAKDMSEKAHELVEKLLDEYQPLHLPKEKRQEIEKIIMLEAKRHGVESLPESKLINSKKGGKL